LRGGTVTGVQPCALPLSKEGRKLVEILAKAGYFQQAVPQLTETREGSYMTVGARIEKDGQPIQLWLYWDTNAKLLRLLRSVRERERKSVGEGKRGGSGCR